MITIYTTDSMGVYTGPQQISKYAAIPPGSFTPPPDAPIVQLQGGTWVVLEAYPEPYVAPLAERQTAAWERIKSERDRRKYLGVKVGEHWFHSDDPSRIQQIALAMMGDAIPAGLQWKTLTKTDQPVFVDMTSALAQGIFQATAASDQAIFAAAEAHRVAMEASDTPESYDISAGWPVSFEDAQ